MGSTYGPAPLHAWWEDERLLQRYIGDLVAAELAQLRPGAVPLAPRPWPATLDLVQDLGVDSLELLQLATALSQALYLHEAGIDDYLLARPQLGQWVAVARAGLRVFDARLSFRTSGSTGQPKPCSHALIDLEQEVDALAALFPGTRRILSAVPSHHMYGFLFSILLPRALGVDDAVQDVRTRTPASLAREAVPGDLIVGHPEFWRAFAAAAPRPAVQAIGVTSTAPCPDEVAQAVLDAGLQRLVQVYGSSETAGIGWRAAAHAPYRLFDFWQRDAADPQALLRTNTRGERSEHRLQDAMLWEDACHFRPNGRIDQAVQVGGVNVFPDQVRRRLLQHPEVLDAVVRPMRPDEGNRLKAFIVPREASVNAEGLRARVETWADSQLSAPERPRAYTFGTRLPLGAMGKAADWMIG